MDEQTVIISKELFEELIKNSFELKSFHLAKIELLEQRVEELESELYDMYEYASDLEDGDLTEEGEAIIAEHHQFEKTMAATKALRNVR